MRRYGLAWLMVIVMGACGFPLLETNGTQVIEVGAACQVDANCNAPPYNNPCKPGTCGAGKNCEYTVLDGVAAPASFQSASDCKTVVCTAGVAAEIEDSADVENDGNSCTTDTCIGGTTKHDMLPDGAVCQQGTKSGTCKANVCQVACTTNTDCDDTNPCTNEFCNSAISTCVFTKLDGIPTPGFQQVPADCKVQSCVFGVDSPLNEDADIDDDSNPCTTDTCNAGTPTHTPLPERTLCMPGGTNVCSSVGQCVQCIVADDCVNIVETECEKRSCVNNTCQIAYQGTDTLASPVLQTANDCRKVVCAGNGGTTFVNDDTDLPHDGNPCTKDICTNGMPFNPPEATGLNCGGSQVCNSMGQCVGCNTVADCVNLPPDDFCKQRTCNNQVCGLAFTPNGTDLPTGQTVGDCKVLECNGMGSVKTSALTSDVPVDNKQCTSDACSIMGVPSNPNLPLYTPCNENGNDACDGNGTCKKSLGKMCGAPIECVSSFCVDGVCCNNSCTTSCRACNQAASMGTCTNVPKGTDDGTCMGATVSCNTDGTCDSENGQTCAANTTCLSNICSDGVCCNSACTSTCQACNVAGGMGTCSNLPLYTNDTSPVCSGTSTCNGAGACKLRNAEVCVNDGDCASNKCLLDTGMKVCQP